MRRLPTRLAKVARCAQAGLLLYILLGSSCTYLAQTPPADHRPQLDRDAELAFMQGEYQEAQDEFQRIYETALAREDRNRALYGLACTQIIMARTDQEVTDGIAYLERWDERKGQPPYQENPHLLVLALKHHSELFITRNREQQRQDSKKDRRIAMQQEQIAQLTATIEKLQKQLDELEAIDENLQEKRKTL